eukprot:901564-Ditylum_brightwellii.AAC.1
MDIAQTLIELGDSYLHIKGKRESSIRAYSDAMTLFEKNGVGYDHPRRIKLQNNLDDVAHKNFCNNVMASLKLPNNLDDVGNLWSGLMISLKLPNNLDDVVDKNFWSNVMTSCWLMDCCSGIGEIFRDGSDSDGYHKSKSSDGDNDAKKALGVVT